MIITTLGTFLYFLSFQCPKNHSKTTWLISSYRSTAHTNGYNLHKILLSAKLHLPNINALILSLNGKFQVISYPPLFGSLHRYKLLLLGTIDEPDPRIYKLEFHKIQFQ